jgi:carotenoid cleavage dioxygenase-like enzyme
MMKNNRLVPSRMSTVATNDFSAVNDHTGSEAHPQVTAMRDKILTERSIEA